MLRTLTFHLPTNLPPPLHAEVIWTSPAYEMNWNRSRVSNFLLMSGRAYGGDILDAGQTWRSDTCTLSSFTGSTRDQRAGLGTALAATRDTSLYSDQPSLFACLLSSLASQSPISLKQSPQLDNGSDVVFRPEAPR